MCLEACTCCCIYRWGYRSLADVKLSRTQQKYFQLWLSWTRFSITSEGCRDHEPYLPCRSCLWRARVGHRRSKLVYEFCLDYVIIWRVHIWDNAEGKENSAVFKVSRLYLLLLSRLSTSNRPPCKWCVSGSHLIAGSLCAVDETQKVITIHSSN